MKLIVVTAKQSTSVNLHAFKNCIQTNIQGLSGIAIVKRVKLWNTAGKLITALAGARKLLTGKAG